MSLPPNETIFRALIDWGHENEMQIREACLSKGGWEGWAQEEMRYLFDAGREDNCYVNGGMMAADIVLTPERHGEHGFSFPYVEEECVIIELKCESYFNALKFKSEVNKDIKKVNNGIFTERLLRCGCNVYCIALATSHEGGCHMEDLGMELFEMEDMAAPFQLYWCVRRIGSEEFRESEDDELDFAVDEEEDDEMQDDEVSDFYEEHEDPTTRNDHANG